MYSYNLIFLWAAVALANAKETGKIALAPNLDFDHPYWFFVPSNIYTIYLSNYLWDVTLLPINAGRIISLTFFIAEETPFPEIIN